jgi:hypothetical protein
MWVTVCDIGTSGKHKDNRKLTKSIPNLCSCRTSPFLFTFHMPPGLGRFVLYARITSDCVTAPPSSCENANPSVKLYGYNFIYNREHRKKVCAVHDQNL